MDRWKKTEYGYIDKRFQCDTLRNLCVENGVQTGPFGSQLHQSDYVSTGVPILTVEHLGNNRIIRDNIPCITLEDRLRLSKYVLHKGDIVFSRVGSVDRRSIIRKEEDGWLFSGRCLRVRPNNHKISSEYLSWFFGLSQFKEYIRKIAVGATMPSLNTKILEGIKIYFPPLSEQKRIASILGSLDDKIELNRRQNETMEAMARALFQSWFVDFDPVMDNAIEAKKPIPAELADKAARRKAAKGKFPALPKEIRKLFPSEFEPSPLGPIPKGWKAGEIQDIAGINTWTLGKRDALDVLDYIEISEVTRGELLTISRYNRGEEPSRARRRLQHGDTILSTVRPDRGAYFLALNPPVSLIASTGFAVLTPKNGNWAFLHAATTRPEFGQELGQLADGGAYPAIRPEVVGERKIVLSTDPSLHIAFENIGQPLLEKADVNRRESRLLATIRDTLLPKLLTAETKQDI